MKTWICKIIGLFFLFGVGHPLTAQTLEIKSVEYLNNKVILHFDLLDSLEGRSYSVRMYSSVDGFLNPLEKASGDIGLEVKSGKNKSITWAVAEEFAPTFSDKVSLELRGRLFIPFIQTEGINNYKVFKRKRKYELTWSGGTPQNILNFDLMRGDKKVTTFPNLSNVGHHTFEFPSHIKPGKNYRFRISDAKNKEDVVFTSKFKIKRKVPLLLKVLPLAVVGYGVYSLVGQSTPGESEILDPPNNP
jgi:hypothetical protein